MKFELKERHFLLIGLIGYLFIFLVTLWHRQPPVFDERLFVSNLYIFDKEGFTKSTLYNMDQAPGPLYEFVHFAFRPFTELTMPRLRLVNIFLLGLLVLLLTRILVLTREMSSEKSLTWALALIAVPMVWQVAGLALTEIPTMVFSVLSLLVMLLAVRAEGSVLKSSLLAIVAGLLSGMAILGRSPFMLLTLASFCLLYNNLGNARRWRIVLLYTAVAIAIAIPFFVLWHGLVPPRQAFVGAGGISVWHGLLAFAYGAMLAIIIAPRWFYFNKRVLLGGIVFYFLFLLLNIYVLKGEYSPLSEALRKVMPPAFMRIYPFLISPFLGTLGVYFIGCCLYQGWRHRDDTVYLYMLACGMLMLASAGAVTHLFSTRYVAQAAPFFVLVMAGYDRPGPFRAGRWLLGMAIGFLSMETYFFFH